MLNIFKQQSELATQLGHQPKDMVEGGAPIYYYLDGALGWESNGSHPIRDDVLSDFYPEAWELSPKDMKSMFNDFYFDKAVDFLNLMALKASTEQLDVVSIPLNDGSAIESKTDPDNDPYWTTHFNVVRAEESRTEVELREVGCVDGAQDFLVNTVIDGEVELLDPEIVMTVERTNGLRNHGSQKHTRKGLLQTT